MSHVFLLLKLAGRGRGFMSSAWQLQAEQWLASGARPPPRRRPFRRLKVWSHSLPYPSHRGGFWCTGGCPDELAGTLSLPDARTAALAQGERLKPITYTHDPPGPCSTRSPWARAVVPASGTETVTSVSSGQLLIPWTPPQWLRVSILPDGKLSALFFN